MSIVFKFSARESEVSPLGFYFCSKGVLLVDFFEITYIKTYISN